MIAEEDLLDITYAKRELEELKTVAKIHSDDPNTQVACSLHTREAGQIRVVVGANRFPKNIERKEERKLRPAKYKWICHSEIDAITRAAVEGLSTKGSIMYLPWYPCVDCAKAIINAEIDTLFCYAPDMNDPTWGEDFKIAFEMLTESNTKVQYIKG